MANPEHVAVVRAGAEAIAKWREESPDERLDLISADLRTVDLRTVDLTDVDLTDANLTDANLSDANLIRTNLSDGYLINAILSRACLFNARLPHANLIGAILIDADLAGANLNGADLTGASLVRANLTGANLAYANLTDANLAGANLTRASLTGANLIRSNLTGANLPEAKLTNAMFLDTVIYNVTLTMINGLGQTIHHGPSCVATDALKRLHGNITPEIETFLRRCGLNQWEIEFARLYDPDLTANEISEIVTTKLFDQRTEGPLYLGGCFISYSQEDSPFVDKLYEQLQTAGASVWLDRHDMVAGDMKRQVFDSIRVQDVVVLVLSKDSIESDWVETELKAARRKEKEQGRDVLCPVALDDTWEAKVKDNPTWGHLTDKLILDFSGWKTKKFQPQFDKLIKGMKINYTVPK